MVTFKSSGKMTLYDFIGTQETNLLVSLSQLPQEMGALSRLDDLYHEAFGLGSISDSDAVIQQLLIYCHFHFYFSAATLLRSHLSEAFASVRTAIEAALHAYRILEGHGTHEEYVSRDKSFVYTPASIRKIWKSNPSVLPLARPLLQVHEQCSQFASHADFDSFLHRLEVVETDVAELRVHYFQMPRTVTEVRMYVLTLIHTFIVILNVFETYVAKRHKVVSDTWGENLRKLGGAVEALRQQLGAKLPPEAKPDAPS